MVRAFLVLERISELQYIGLMAGTPGENIVRNSGRVKLVLNRKSDPNLKYNWRKTGWYSSRTPLVQKRGSTVQS